MAASRPGPVAACVTVEHRDDAVVLEVACGRSRAPGSRPGQAPAALAERAALLGGTVEVTSCREAVSVRVVLPAGASVPATAPAVASAPATAVGGRGLSVPGRLVPDTDVRKPSSITAAGAPGPEASGTPSTARPTWTRLRPWTSD